MMDRTTPLPDFLVIGAMKSGTTALHSLLDQHPNVLMGKPKEPFFFDRDDPYTHPNFFVQAPDAWRSFDWFTQKDELLKQYGGVFQGGSKDILRGEASTTYLASVLAPSRIADVIPEAKLVVILRNPTDRAYSTYWHLVRTGRTSTSFKKAIQYHPLEILERGAYFRQISRYKRLFRTEQFVFLIFEAFVEDWQRETSRLWSFLGIQAPVGDERLPMRNPALVPRWLRLQWGLNFVSKLVSENVVSPNLRGLSNERPQPMLSVLRRVRQMNLKVGPYPPMDRELRRHLDTYYERENTGLSTLIGRSLDAYWKQSN